MILIRYWYDEKIYNWIFLGYLFIVICRIIICNFYSIIFVYFEYFLEIEFIFFIFKNNGKIIVLLYFYLEFNFRFFYFWDENLVL